MQVAGPNIKELFWLRGFMASVAQHAYNVLSGELLSASYRHKAGTKGTRGRVDKSGETGGSGLELLLFTPIKP